MNLNTDLHWPAAPGWALATGELGRWLIFLGIAAFASSFLLSALFPRWSRWTRAVFTVGCVAILGSFACLAALFVNQQYEFETIRQSIANGLAIKYRIAAIWAHQEGSFLLWGTTSAIFGLLTIGGTGIYRRWYAVAYSGFLGSLCGILAYESPFKLIPLTHGHMLVPPDGAGLTPALQNYWVVIHPPTIFTGFGSLTVLACYALAAMLTGDFVQWVRQVRPWALLSVAILGLGLCMGGFWAYETLGWGGFWAWDPVENVSFVPWILAITFVHGIIVQVAKGRWQRANLLLGGVPFLAFVYGTFLTRSGLYADVSVHSFAQMDHGALNILLGFLIAAVLTFLAVWLVKTWRLEVPAATEGLQRESLYQSGMLLLGGIGVATGIGMSVPLIMSLMNLKAKVVEEHLYHVVLVWPVLPMLVLVALTPFAGWRSIRWKDLFNRISTAASLAFLLSGVTLFFLRQPWSTARPPDDPSTIQFPFGLLVPTLPWVMFLIFLAYFAAIANIWRIAELFRRSKFSIGGLVAHLGVATLLAGMFISRGLERKQLTEIQEGTPGEALGYTVAYDGSSGADMTDRDHKALFTVTKGDSSFIARPGLYYTIDGDGIPQPTTWPHIQRGFFNDVYVALHPPQLNVWKDPAKIKPGQTIDQDGVRVTYEKMVMNGQPGQIGTTFGAQLRVKEPEGVFRATPMLQLTSQGLEPVLAPVGNDLMASMVGMDAGDQSALIQIHFAKAVYPIELYYKPMTSLVWLGAGILFIGGVLSAWYRRPVRQDGAAEEMARVEESDAVAPVAQV